MKRRNFLAASCIAPLAAAGGAVAAAEDKPKKQLLELRLYKADSEAMAKGLVTFLGAAAIPAWNRLGIKPVGVFTFAKEGVHDVYVLLPHDSCRTAFTATRKMMADAEFCKAGKTFLNAEKAAPAFKRIESSLMLAFDGAPKVEVPTKKASRIFQLRIYEAYSVKKGLKKIEMFNTGGELAVFRDTGMDPVFFGETLIGTRVPNLTYMLGFDDEAAQKKAWGKFGGDPRWKKLKSDPQYKDTVSNHINIMLRPAACSQI